MMQVQLTGTDHFLTYHLGFLEERTPQYVSELWSLLLAAQDDPTGIPPALIREKQDEKQRKMEQIALAQKQLDKIRAFTGGPPSQEA